jgi:hypothetical protein
MIEELAVKEERDGLICNRRYAPNEKTRRRQKTAI